MRRPHIALLALGLLGSSACGMELPEEGLIIDTRVLAIRTEVTAPLAPEEDPEAAPRAQALPLEFLQRFAVIGPAEHCIERLRQLVALGVRRLVIIGLRPDHFGVHAERALERFAREVLPALKA